jgi:hypothetical protein
MKREDMTCINCIKFDPETPSRREIGVMGRGPQTEVPEPACRLDPNPYRFIDSPYSPRTHWCSQGEWREWSERFGESLPILWGEWEAEPSDNNTKTGGTE